MPLEASGPKRLRISGKAPAVGLQDLRPPVGEQRDGGVGGPEVDPQAVRGGLAPPQAAPGGAQDEDDGVIQ